MWNLSTLKLLKENLKSEEWYKDSEFDFKRAIKMLAERTSSAGRSAKESFKFFNSFLEENVKTYSKFWEDCQKYGVQNSCYLFQELFKGANYRLQMRKNFFDFRYDEAHTTKFIEALTSRCTSIKSVMNVFFNNQWAIMNDREESSERTIYKANAYQATLSTIEHLSMDGLVDEKALEEFFAPLRKMMMDMSSTLVHEKEKKARNLLSKVLASYFSLYLELSVLHLTPNSEKKGFVGLARVFFDFDEELAVDAVAGLSLSLNELHLKDKAEAGKQLRGLYEWVLIKQLPSKHDVDHVYLGRMFAARQAMRFYPEVDSDFCKKISDALLPLEPPRALLDELEKDDKGRKLVAALKLRSFDNLTDHFLNCIDPEATAQLLVIAIKGKDDEPKEDSTLAHADDGEVFMIDTKPDEALFADDDHDAGDNSVDVDDFSIASDLEDEQPDLDSAEDDEAEEGMEEGADVDVDEDKEEKASDVEEDDEAMVDDCEKDSEMVEKKDEEVYEKVDTAREEEEENKLKTAVQSSNDEDEDLVIHQRDMEELDPENDDLEDFSICLHEPATPADNDVDANKASEAPKSHPEPEPIDVPESPERPRTPPPALTKRRQFEPRSERRAPNTDAPRRYATRFQKRQSERFGGL